MNIYSAKEVAYMSKPSDQIITIQIDGKEIKVSKKEMTGKENQGVKSSSCRIPAYTNRWEAR